MQRYLETKVVDDLLSERGLYRQTRKNEKNSRVIRKLYLFIDNLNAEKMLKIYQKALIPSAPNAGQ